MTILLWSFWPQSSLILGCLLPLAVELHGVGAGHVLYVLLLREEVRCLYVAALV